MGVKISPRFVWIHICASLGKVVECADHVIGCVENIIKSRTDGDLSHEMRYCMDPSRRNRTTPMVIDPRKDHF